MDSQANKRILPPSTPSLLRNSTVDLFVAEGVIRFLTGHDSFQSDVVHCHSQHILWGTLSSILASSNNCFEDFIIHMNAAYHTHGEPHCHGACSVISTTPPSTVTPTTTDSSRHHHHSTSAELYKAYQSGECLSQHTVWSFLYDNLPSGVSKETVITHMTDLYPAGREGRCVCTKKFDLQFHSYHHDAYYKCIRHHTYRGIIQHLLNVSHASPQICHSHIVGWRDIEHLLKNDPSCLNSLLFHMQDSIRRQGDPCSCHPVTTTTIEATTKHGHAHSHTTHSITTTAHSATNSTHSITTTAHSATNSTHSITTTAHSSTTTTHHATNTATPSPTSSPATVGSTTPVFSNLNQTINCSKIRTVTELAKFQQLYPHLNADCSNSVSNLIVDDLCDVLPVTKHWRPGQRVVDSCDTLSLFSAVATFTDGEYRVDGLAGVFVGCTNSTVKIATQECGGKFEILEISRNSGHPTRFSHTASNYFAIML